MRAIKDNKVYTVSDADMNEYLALGYDIFDNNGKLIKRSPKSTVSYAEYEAVLKERDELKELVSTLKGSGDRLSSMELDELKAYALEKGIDLGNATSRDGIIKKIKAAE